MRGMMSKLKLTVNETKTRLCRVPERDVRLPGLHHRQAVTRPRRAGPTWARGRQRKKIARLCQAIHAMTGRNMVWAEAEDRMTRLNRLLTRLGELLLPGTGEQGVPCGRSVCTPSAPTVVACEAQAFMSIGASNAATHRRFKTSQGIGE